jgi:hypothetical protein
MLFLPYAVRYSTDDHRIAQATGEFQALKKLTLTLTKEQKEFFSETGRAGGQTRAKNLSSARRLQIARQASKAAAKARTLKARERRGGD